MSRGRSGCVRSHHRRRGSRIATANGQKSRFETRWMVARIKVACTTARRPSARVNASLSKPSSRDQSPMYIEGAYCAWIPPIRSSARGMGRRARCSSSCRARRARLRSCSVSVRKQGRTYRPGAATGARDRPGLARRRFQEAEVDGVADRAAAVQAARVRELRVHDDDVARLELERLRAVAVERPDEQGSVVRTRGAERDADNPQIPAPVRPLRKLVDVRRDLVLAVVGWLQDDLRVAHLTVLQLAW